MADPTPTVRHESVDLGEVDLHVALAGDPAAELVVFLHGFPEFWYAWKTSLVELGRDRLAAAPDQRGYNRSSKPDAVEAYRIERLVGDVIGLADRLGKERFAVVGHDWGGVVAWMTAIAHPRRVTRLVAVNAPHPAVFRRELGESFAQKWASAYMLAFRIPGFARILTARGCALLERLVLSKGLEEGWLSEADREAYLEAWSRPGAIDAGLKWYRASSARSGDAERDWTVRVPTLVVWGMRDRYLRPGCLEGLDAYVPDLEVRRVADAGHWIVHRKPDLVNGAIREFLDG